MLDGKEKIIGLVVGLAVALAVTFIPALEPLKESLTEILLLLAAWILGGAGVEIANKLAAEKKG